VKPFGKFILMVLSIFLTSVDEFFDRNFSKDCVLQMLDFGQELFNKIDLQENVLVGKKRKEKVHVFFKQPFAYIFRSIKHCMNLVESFFSIIFLRFCTKWCSVLLLAHFPPPCGSNSVVTSFHE
jgi:hypothetical protein